MSWILLAPKGSSSPGSSVHVLPPTGIVHIVQTLQIPTLHVAHDLQPGVHTELGRIAIGSWGVKLTAVETPLEIRSGQGNDSCSSAAIDPRVEKYRLQPRNGGFSESIFLRHMDVLNPLNSTASLTCIWNAPEVLVDSSAVETKAADDVDAIDNVAETPEDDTEDEDLNKSAIAVEVTQGVSQQLDATPQLSHQRSVIIQETPTAARVNNLTDYPAVPPLEMEVSEHASDNDTHSPENTHQTEMKDTPQHMVNHTLKGSSDDTPHKSLQPKVLITKKRPSPALEESDPDVEPVSRTTKRVRRTAPSDDTDDSVLGNIVADTSPAHTPSTKEKKLKPGITSYGEIAQDTPLRSQKSSQRSTAATTTDLHDGNPPRVALSNSSMTEKSHAVKFLKKQGGSLVDSVKASFDVLCVRDGDLHKTPKVLLAVAKGTPIVTEKWLTDSAKAGQFLDVGAYTPSAPQKEHEWDFRLEEVMGRAQTPFEGYTIHFTTALHGAYKTFGEIEQVCKAAGAAKVTKKKMDKSEKVIVLAAEDGDKDAEHLMEDGVKCFNRDLLPLSIFRGVVDLEGDEFRINTGSSGTKDTKKKKTRKS